MITYIRIQSQLTSRFDRWFMVRFTHNIFNKDWKQLYIFLGMYIKKQKLFSNQFFSFQQLFLYSAEQRRNKISKSLMKNEQTIRRNKNKWEYYYGINNVLIKVRSKCLLLIIFSASQCISLCFGSKYHALVYTNHDVLTINNKTTHARTHICSSIHLFIPRGNFAGENQRTQSKPLLTWWNNAEH